MDDRPSELRADELVRQGELIVHVADHATDEGPASSVWPGLTFYRFSRPVPPHDDEVASLSICLVVQGRKRVTVDGRDHFYDPFNFFVMTQGMRFTAEVLEATSSRPLLSIVLQIDPDLVTSLLSEIQLGPTVLFSQTGRTQQGERAYVSPIDQNLVGAMLRFLRAVDIEADRRILAPMYLRELVYRVLRSEQWNALADAARREKASNPITGAIAYMQDALGEPIGIQDVADHVAMSQSAFAHLFKETTGTSPYQYLKRLRLDKARALMVGEDLSVSAASNRVGYGSVSHFITEFKRTFGETPRSYADRLRKVVTLHVADATR